MVHDEAEPRILGIVTVASNRSVTVTWEHGGRSGGPGMLLVLRHIDPARRIDVPRGAHAVRYWNREQSVTAALRRAGLRKSTIPCKRRDDEQDPQTTKTPA